MRVTSFRILILALLFASNAAFCQWDENLISVTPDEVSVGDNFGSSLAIDGDYAVVAARTKLHISASDGQTHFGVGAVYVYFRNSAGDWTYLKKLMASDYSQGDEFGSSVSISGDYIVVGAQYEDEDETGSNRESNAGSAYVFKKDHGGTDSWGEIKKIVADDREFDDRFGVSVDVGGDYIVVGALSEDRDLAPGHHLRDAGAAYIFRKDEGGVDGWGQIKKIVSSDESSDDFFGGSVSISGELIAVSAVEDVNETELVVNAGAVYLFQKDQGGDNHWGELKRIIAPDLAAEDRFGNDIFLSNNYLIVGARLEDDDTSGLRTVSSAGSAYIYEKDQDGLNNWGFIQKLVSFDRSEQDLFGTSVAISDEYAIVGSSSEDEDELGSNAVNSAGAVYVFKKSTNGWTLQQKLVASDRLASDKFGSAVAMGGNAILVGAPDKDYTEPGVFANSAGAAYFYSKNYDVLPGFSSQDFITYEENGTDAVIDVNASGAAAPDEGIAYSLSGYDAELLAINTETGSLTFLSSPDFESPEDGDGDNHYQVVVAAQGETGISNQFLIIQVLDVASPTFTSGSSVSIEEGTMGVVLDVNANDTGSGSDENITYTISGDDMEYLQIDEMNGYLSFINPPDYETPLDADANNVYVVSVIAKNVEYSEQVIMVTVTDVVEDPTITVIGMPSAFSTLECSASDIQSIEVSGVNLTEVLQIVAPDHVELSTDGESYTTELAIQPVDGTVNPTTVYVRVSVEAAVGDFQGSILLSSLNAESREVIVDLSVSDYEPSGWYQFGKLVANDRAANDWFGRYSVSIHEDYAVVGVERDDEDEAGTNPLEDAGSAYVFKKNASGEWSQIKKLVAEDREAGDDFGASVAIYGDYIFVGADQKHFDLGGPNQATFAGAVYVFAKNEGGTDNWGQLQKITLIDPSIAANLGGVIALNGQYAAISAINTLVTGDEGPISQAGAVFVFKYNETSQRWEEDQMITASDAQPRDLFGRSLAMSENHILVGAWNEDFDSSTDDDAGAAYLFSKNSDGSWSETKKIIAPERTADDRFGISVAISEELALVGAYWEDEDENDGNTLTNSGSAYLFGRDEGGSDSWGFVQKLVADERVENGEFARTVGIGNDAIFVGANLTGGGVIHVFQQEAGSWNHTNRLTSRDNSPGDHLGLRMATSGNSIIAAAPFEDHDINGENLLSSSGSAYVFDYVDKTIVLDPVSSCTSYDFHGMILEESGTYVAIDDCDRSVSLDFTYEGLEVTETVEACERYVFDEVELLSSGTYNATFTSSLGCDSLVTLHLTILTSDEVEESVEVCDSYLFDGVELVESGTYSAIFLNSMGCDSLVTLDLTILESHAVTLARESCESFTFDGEVLTTSGSYSGLFTNTFGCDSLVTLELTILEANDVNEEVEACETYLFNGNELTSSGIYTGTFLNVAGCDSLVTLDLTILESHQVYETRESCESFLFNGEILTTSGSYSALFANAVGCDSLVTLDLTILETNNVNEEINACDVYVFDGNELNSSGIYSATFLNAAGCDSLVTLDLTILQSDEVSSERQACEGYQFGTQAINESGMYQEVFINQFGCDSLVSLDIEILDEPVAEIELDGSVLVASEQPDVQYQWYDCDSGELVPGENNSQFSPTESRNYSVEVSNGVCLVRSNCIPYERVLGAAEELREEVKIYPTITNKAFTIESKSPMKNVRIRILTVDGRALVSKEFKQFSTYSYTIDGATGIYLIEMVSAGQVLWTGRVVKK